MAIKDYSTEPDMNATISGINIAEGCAPSGINNAIRQLMADVKAAHEERDSAQEERDTAQDAAISAKVATVNGLTPDSDGNVDVGGMPLGTLIPYTGKDVPAGTLRADGTTYTNMRTAFPEFYEWVVNFGLTVPLADYALVEGSCGFYGLDASTGTVRMPTLAAGVFGTPVAGQYGQAVQAGLPNIEGAFQSRSAGGSNILAAYPDINTGGAITYTGLAGAVWSANLSISSNTAQTKNAVITLDASKSSAVYGKSDTVTPSHIKYPWVIVVYNAAVSASVAQAGEFIELLDGKENKGAVRSVNGVGADATGHATVPVGIPDSRKVDINWGSTFIAPADGFVMMFGATNDANTCRIRILVAEAGIDETCNTYGFPGGNPVGVTAPVGKGMSCSFEAYNVTVRRCQFIYAKGAY